jgi:hypothetical protein
LSVKVDFGHLAVLPKVFGAAELMEAFFALRGELHADNVDRILYNDADVEQVPFIT